MGRLRGFPGQLHPAGERLASGNDVGCAVEIVRCTRLGLDGHGVFHAVEHHPVVHVRSQLQRQGIAPMQDRLLGDVDDCLLYTSPSPRDS